MEFIGFFQVLIIVTAIITLLYTCFRSLKFSCWPFYTSFSSSADDDDDDIPAPREKYDGDDIPPPKYDVFISFRGEDTRTTITSHLHRALLQKKIETYIDNRLVSGGEIAPALLEAIEKSTLSLVIFSQNYASSTWCLDELAHILHCREKYGQLVIPIFYGTDPSTVRKQKGSYEVAFAQLEKRFKGNIGKVNVWRDALTTAANLSGFSNKTGPTLQAIFFNRSAIQGILWNHADSEKMYDLRLLYVYNSSRNKYCKVKVSLPDSLTYLDWEGYPFNSLPSKLSPENLVEIQMRNSQVEQLEGQNLINLRVMDLGLSKHLMEVPDLSQSPNIEHINLSGTAIKSVPASIGNLKSLEELDLSGTAITCLPASIKEASRLICLRLTNCRSLESLPELPGVRWLQAHGCTSLEKVLSSKTALTLGWDEYKNSQGLQEQLTFSNCIGMGWDAWCDILTDSQIRIVRMAIALSRHFKQEDIEVASHLEFEDESKVRLPLSLSLCVVKLNNSGSLLPNTSIDEQEYVFRSPFCVVCSGNIIPRWFPYEVHKSVLQIKLGPNFFSTDFLGFAYSVVVAFKNYNVRGSLRLGCKINFKGRGDHCIYHRSCMVAEYGEINECKFDEPHSFVWFSTLDHVKQGSYNGVTEAIFDFYPIVDDLPHGGAIDCSKIEVTMCGVYPMYARYMWFSYSMNRQF
ncbi:hypothetical protein DVH24_025294 [Malus domestica]|uniref:TIR domain-containing protein n=1 Tax=Malus domestica TaxID=3750 RepID=A0A498HSE0_MALDO|nr:hypothetical protein DVH24_025294 [Malus domestica]